MNQSRSRTCGDAGGRRADGEPCRGKLSLSEAGLCVFHDPDRVDELRAMRAAGGSAAAAAKRKAKAADPEGVPRAPRTIEDATRWASWATWAVATGQIDARTAHEIGYVLRAFLDAQKHVDKVDDRMKNLTDKLKRLGEAEERAGGPRT